MEIRDFLEHKQAGVLSVAPGHALQQAAEIMTSHGVGALVITDEAGNLLGIVTERDLTRAIATYGADLIDKPVRDVMTEKVVTCDIDQSVVEVLYLMKSNGVRHRHRQHAEPERRLVRFDGRREPNPSRTGRKSRIPRRGLIGASAMNDRNPLPDYFSTLKILIVDDQVYMRELIQSILLGLKI